MLSNLVPRAKPEGNGSGNEVECYQPRSGDAFGAVAVVVCLSSLIIHH